MACIRAHLRDCLLEPPSCGTELSWVGALASWPTRICRWCTSKSSTVVGGEVRVNQDISMRYGSCAYVRCTKERGIALILAQHSGGRFSKIKPRLGLRGRCK